MFEDILANTSLPPETMALCALAAIVCFAVGWLGRSAGVKRREEEHKRDVLEAKSSIPQLESMVRKRESEVSRLELEVKELTDHNGELSATVGAKDHDLRSSVREAKNLRSELDAVKGTRVESGNVIMDGFEDENAANTADSQLQAQLEKSQALYDKLKQALIERDERIDQLEGQLLDSSSASEAPQPQLELAEPELASVAPAGTESANAEVAGLQAAVERLQTQLQESQAERDMLADMAKRRSESNHALKEASAEVQAQLPQLEQDLAERDETISNREASIKRLLDELEETKAAKSQLEDQTASLSTELTEREAEAAEFESKFATLQFSLSQREERITILGGDIDNLRQELEQSRAAAATLREAAAAELASATAAVDQQQQAMGEREAQLTAELGEQQQQRSKLVREIEDLQANLQQREKWIGKLKESLSEREAQSRQLEARALDAESALQAAPQSQPDTAGVEQAAEARASDRKLAAAEAETARTRAQLKELEQSLAVYKNAVADHEVNITLAQPPFAKTAETARNVVSLPRPARRPRGARAIAPRRARRTMATTLAFRPRRQSKKRR